MNGPTAAFRISGPETTEKGRRFRVEIPLDSRLFEGHFPGQPILPGIAHLALVRQALAEAGEGEPFLSEIRSLKLRRPVEPGVTLELLLSGPGEDGAVRFELRRPGEPPEGVSQGVVRIGTAPGEERSPSEGEEVGTEITLPHTAPARLVTQALYVSPDEVVCRAEIPLDHPLVVDKKAPSFLGLEAGAQAAAALESLGGDGTGGPRIGYVVAIRDARFEAPWLPAGRPFRVKVQPSGSAPPLSVYEVRVEEGGEWLTGSVSTYLP